MHDDHAHHAGAGHGDLASYLKGFFLSILLTVVPFWLVMHPALPRMTIIAVVVVLALAQVVAHLVYFLHMNGKSEQRWNLAAFAFTVMVVILLIGGSVWIMVNLADNVMPMPAAMPM